MSDQKPQSVGAAQPAAAPEDPIPDDQWAQLLNHSRLAEAIASASRMSGAQPPVEQARKSADAPRKQEVRPLLRRSEGQSHGPAQPAAVQRPTAATAQQRPQVVAQPPAEPVVQRPAEPAAHRPAEAAVPQPPEKEQMHSEEGARRPAEGRQPPVEGRQLPVEESQPPEAGRQREQSAPLTSKPPRRPTPSRLPRHEHGESRARVRARSLAGPVLGALLVHLVLGTVLAAWLLGSDQPDVRLAAEPAPAPSASPGAVPAWQGDVPAGAPADVAPAAGPPPRPAGPTRPRTTQEAPPESQAQANVHKTAALVAASNLAELKMIGEAIAAQEEHPKIEPAPAASRRPQAGTSALTSPAQEERAQSKPTAPSPSEALSAVIAASDGPRIFLHYTASSPAAGERAHRLLTFLRERGVVDTMELRPVDMPIRQGSVRYFFSNDRPAARRVSDMLIGFYGAGASTAAAVLDLTHYQPRPRPGILEIWIPSS